MMKSAMTFFLADDDADDTGLFCEALQEVDQGVICYTAERLNYFQIRNSASLRLSFWILICLC
jgi:hypothetical protein